VADTHEALDQISNPDPDSETLEKLKKGLGIASGIANAKPSPEDDTDEEYMGQKEGYLIV
jgi:hypothetical protein